MQLFLERLQVNPYTQRPGRLLPRPGDGEMLVEDVRVVGQSGESKVKRVRREIAVSGDRSQEREGLEGFICWNVVDQR